MLDSTDHEQDPAARDLRARLTELRARLNPEKPEPLHKRPKLRLIQGGKAGLLAPWFALLDHVKEHAVATVTVAATVPLLLVGPTMSLPESPDPLLTDIGAPAFASPDAGTTQPLAPRGDSGRVSATRPPPETQLPQLPQDAVAGSGPAGAALTNGPLASEIPLTTAPAAAQILPVLEPIPDPVPAPPQPVPEPVDEPAPVPVPAPEPTEAPTLEPEPEPSPAVQERVAGCVENAAGGGLPDCAGLGN